MDRWKRIMTVLGMRIFAVCPTVTHLSNYFFSLCVYFLLLYFVQPCFVLFWFLFVSVILPRIIQTHAGIEVQFFVLFCTEQHASLQAFGSRVLSLLFLSFCTQLYFFPLHGAYSTSLRTRMNTYARSRNSRQPQALIMVELSSAYPPVYIGPVSFRL